MADEKSWHTANKLVFGGWFKRRVKACFVSFAENSKHRMIETKINHIQMNPQCVLRKIHVLIIANLLRHAGAITLFLM
jgi:hypothetical protein